MYITIKEFLQKFYPYEILRDDLREVLSGCRKIQFPRFEDYNWEEKDCRSKSFRDVRYLMNGFDFHKKAMHRDAYIWIFIQNALWTIIPGIPERWTSMAFGFTANDFDGNGNLLASSYERVTSNLDRELSRESVQNEAVLLSSNTSLWVDQMKRIKDEQQG